MIDYSRHYFFVALVLAFSFLAGCTSQESVLRVGTNVWVGYEPLYLARDKGFFSDKQIQMVELLSASDVMTAFREGMIDVAALTLDEAISLAADAIPLKVFLVMDISKGADSLLARKDIPDLSALKGKNIGVEKTAVGAVMLDSALKRAGLQLDDIHVEHLTADQHVDAYRLGRIDAVVTFEPNISMLQKLDARVIFDSSQIPGRIIDVLVMQPEVAQTHKQALSMLVDSHFKALDFIRHHPEDAAELMAVRLQVDSAEVMPMFDGLLLPDRQLNQQMFADNAAQLQSSTELLADSLNRAGLINSVVASAHLFDTGFIKQP